eukprot:4348651-Pleurochrysis_carterae.AAC.1
MRNAFCKNGALLQIRQGLSMEKRTAEIALRLVRLRGIWDVSINLMPVQGDTVDTYRPDRVEIGASEGDIGC